MGIASAGIASMVIAAAGFASMIIAYCMGFASMNIAGTCLREHRLHEFIVGDQSVQGCRRGGC